MSMRVVTREVYICDGCGSEQMGEYHNVGGEEYYSLPTEWKRVYKNKFREGTIAESREFCETCQPKHMDIIWKPL